MAKTVLIEIKAKLDEATEAIKGITDSLEESKAETKKLQDEIERIGKSSKKAEKGINAIKKGFSGVGLAIKAMGIGLLLEAFSFLKETMMENQKVADFFATTFEALSIAFNDFFTFIFDNAGAVTDFFKEIFENPLKSIEKLGTLIKENLIERFESLLEVAGFLGDAFAKLFDGDFAGAFESVKQAGEEMVDVFTGVDNTLQKVNEIVVDVTASIISYTTETINSAKSNVALAKSANMAAAQLTGLIEKFDRSAEIQRQIRDEERNTIGERIKANNELGKILEQQEVLMLKQVDIVIAAAQAQHNKNQNDANYIALLEAQNEKLGVLAQIEGFRSEQKVNDLALDREQLELTKSIIDGETERTIKEKNFSDEQILNDVKRLESRRTTLMEIAILENERLTKERDSYNKGTQAWQDAENERLAASQDSNQQQIALETELGAAKKTIAVSALSAISGLLGQFAEENKGFAIAASIINTLQGITSVFAGNPLVPFPVKLIQAAAIGAAGFMQVRKIQQQDVRGGVSSGASVSGVSATPANPSVSIAAATNPQTQISNALNRQSNKPVRSFVLSQDVTTNQAFDRRLGTNALFAG